MIELSWPDSKLSPNNKNGKHWSVYQKAIHRLTVWIDFDNMFR